MAQKTLTTNYLSRLSNANHDGVTQQIDDRFAAFDTDNTMLQQAFALVHQRRQAEDAAFKRFSGKDFASAELTALTTVLLGIEERAKLYYISGGKTSGGSTSGDGGPADNPIPSNPGTDNSDDEPTPQPNNGSENSGDDDLPDPSGGGTDNSE